MSSLIGNPGERWTLARATDAMGAAARQVGKPGLIWLLGFFYPSLTLTAGYGGELLLGLLGTTHARPDEDVQAAFVLLLLVMLVLSPRLSAGLARIAEPETWAELCAGRRTPRLRSVWQAGRGLGWATLGLWLTVLLMLLAPALVVLAPPLYVLEHLSKSTDFAGERSVLFTITMGPFTGLVLLLGLVLSVIYQLALQSLVHNRRGVGSALLHAWRIARHEPWSTARAILVDFLATLIVTSVQLALWLSAWAWLTALCCAAPVIFTLAFVRRTWFVRTSRIVYGLLLLMVPGLIGVVRAAYWSRVYRALGGLTPIDSVPGLPAAPLVLPADRS